MLKRNKTRFKIFFFLSQIFLQWANWSRDYAGGTVDENLPANAGDMGSIPAPEDSTHGGATEPSGLKPAHSRVHEPQWMSPCDTTMQQEKPPQWEARAPKLERSRHSLQLEKALMQQQRLRAAKNI